MNVSSNTTLQILGAFAAGALCATFVSKSSRAVPTRTPGKAWVLAVKLSFEGPLADQAATEFLAAFTECAKLVRTDEPRTVGYEISKNTKNPLEFFIYERYAEFDAYLKLHKTTQHFAVFRPKLQALQDQGAVTISGQAYEELGLGFM